MKTRSVPHVLLISNVNSTFVKHDESLLAEATIVKKFIVGQEKSFFAFIMEQIKVLIFIIKNIRGSAVMFCWFADYHSFLPAFISKWFGKSFYLIQGGYDTTNISEINYGVHTNKWRSAMVDYAIKNATLNLPVSSFLAGELQARYGNHLPIEVLHTGYIVEEAKDEIKEDIVLTVAVVDSQKRMLIKGVDRFIALASEMPDILFNIIGVKATLLESYILPNNLKCREALSKAEVDEYYKKAAVYCQFSLREGLPNAVLEAMSYKCVVVGMNHSGIAEAVGDAGFLLDEWNINSAKQLVERALEDTLKGLEGRARVEEYFNEDKRRRRLQELINFESKN
jgi:glycosyltransferase involved in cell wall biosynthesis